MGGRAPLFALLVSVLSGVAHAATWHLGGYLPEKPTEKVWLTIDGKAIRSVETTRPEGEVVDTDALIFPGLIDLHNHLKYNVLPLWDEAKGQFQNRFEWRGLSKYKEAVGGNMREINADPEAVCAAVRWAEIKALTGGATAVQGIGTDEKCGRGFGIKNVEISDEYENGGSIRARVDIVAPEFRDLYDDHLDPHIEDGHAAPASFARDYDSAWERLERKEKDEALEKKFKRYEEWNEAPRKSTLKHLDKEGSSFFVHLCEGRQDDEYNQWEWRYGRKSGVARDGLVVIHGVGMDKRAFDYAAKHGVSLVWSPFSNLLLYGETLDVAGAIKAGVNVAMGCDWTPTGSKHLLDELKIARGYLKKKKISIGRNADKVLASMVTTNAAKALKLDEPVRKGGKLVRPCVGKVAADCWADLTLVDRGRKKNAYSQLVASNQENVALVVINGEAVYGDEPLMKKRHGSALERLPVEESAACAAIARRPKALRAPEGAGFRVSAIRAKLEGKLKKGLLDPLLNCEDDDYRARFGSFVEKEVP